MNNSVGSVVVAPRVDHTLFINRRNNRAASLPPAAAEHLQTALQDRAPFQPQWLRDVFAEIGEDHLSEGEWGNAIVLRRAPVLEFERAVWEITERCNFRCIHCYIDEKTRPGLALGARLSILDKLECAGCLWLQLTGGEALADPLFEQTYQAAWNKGFLPFITTNGRLIGRWLDLFRRMPPYRLTVSLYGASAASYGAMAGAEAAFKEVMDGLDAACAAGLRVRVSIIVTQANSHEVADMEELMRHRGIEHHTYWRLSPTLLGRDFPLGVEAEQKRHATFFQESRGCSGGTAALHIYASGRASPCRLLPYISVDMVSENISDLRRLRFHPGTKPTMPECASCPSSGQCTTCAPVYALHKKAGKTRGRVCRW